MVHQLVERDVLKKMSEIGPLGKTGGLETRFLNNILCIYMDITIIYAYFSNNIHQKKLFYHFLLLQYFSQYNMT